MKKFLSVIFVLILILGLTACTEKTPEEKPSDKTPSEITIDINAVKNAIIEKAELTDPLELGTEQLCELYDIDVNDVAEAVCVTTLDGTFPDEVIIIKAANGEAKSRIIEKLSAHLDDVKVQSQNYDAENYALAQECKIIEKGNFIALFISAKHAQMEKILEESVN
ncbi:MAG: DUF4358 domain-containing protein [Oscillospiraceae bacterium]|nr:DUF4358 domain-containing protein [Oscillospiraceae bacterium]